MVPFFFFSFFGGGGEGGGNDFGNWMHIDNFDLYFLHKRIKECNKI